LTFPVVRCPHRKVVDAPNDFHSYANPPYDQLASEFPANPSKGHKYNSLPHWDRQESRRPRKRHPASVFDKCYEFVTVGMGGFSASSPPRIASVRIRVPFRPELSELGFWRIASVANRPLRGSFPPLSVIGFTVGKQSIPDAVGFSYFLQSFCSVDVISDFSASGSAPARNIASASAHSGASAVGPSTTSTCRKPAFCFSIAQV